METCSIGALNVERSIEIITLSSDEVLDCEDEKMEDENLPEVESNLKIEIKGFENKKLKTEKIESREGIFGTLENKKLKTKKLKVRRTRGEKRKFPEKNESRKKVKSNKKDEKPLAVVQTQFQDNNIIKDDDEVKVLLSIGVGGEPELKTLFKKDDSLLMILDNDSDSENREVKMKEKSKQMSARKSKALTNACRETLQVLEGFGLDILTSINKSLKFLKNHNVLNNKLISMDTLMDLIELAMNTENTLDFGDAERESNLAKIVSKVTMGAGTTPKGSKAKKNILAPGSSPKNKSQSQEDASTSDSSLKKPDDQDGGFSKNQDQDSKAEESEVIPLSPEKVQEQAVEKSGNNFCITNYFKKLKKTVEEKNKNERFSCFSAKTDMFIAPKLGGELKGTRRQIFEEEFNNQTCEVNYLVERPSKYSNNEVVRTSGKTAVQESTSDSSPNDVVNMSIDSVNGETSPKSVKETVVKQDLNEVQKGNEGIKTDSEKLETSVVQSSAKLSQTPRKKVALIRVDQPKITQTQPLPPPPPGRMKAKLFQFHDNRRPPYWGTWRRKSESVRPRKPFAKDKNFNYEIDSDDEWEEEEEPGESLHGSDDEKEPEEDYEVDNDFFVPHGYLSDDENPEKENLSPKAKLDLLEEQFTCEQKQKTRKMTPLVFGTFWVHKGSPPEGSLFQDLQLERLHAFSWSPFPIQVDEEDEKKMNESVNDHVEGGTTPNQTKKSRAKNTFPNEEIPTLIKLIHGSPQNSDMLAKKFLLQRESDLSQDGKRPVGLTKTCVLKKLKEIATWQTSQEKGKMCWFVPKETRQEFGVDVQDESSDKKPQKCFIWKFIRKNARTSGSEPSSEEQGPQVVILESGADCESTAVVNMIT